MNLYAAFFKLNLFISPLINDVSLIWDSRCILVSWPCSSFANTCHFLYSDVCFWCHLGGLWHYSRHIANVLYYFFSLSKADARNRRMTRKRPMFLSLLFTVILFTGKELVPAIFKTKVLVRLRRHQVSIGS